MKDLFERKLPLHNQISNVPILGATVEELSDISEVEKAIRKNNIVLIKIVFKYL